MSKRQNPAEFLKQIIGKPVVVKLNSGVDYRGILACLDGFMNIALEQTEEYSNGTLQNKYESSRNGDHSNTTKYTVAKMMNVHQPRDSNDSQRVNRLISSFSKKAKDRELLICPRCKSPMKPDFVRGKKTKVWWMCRNVEKCGFPLDMPSTVFCVEQVPQQEKDGFIPLPNIEKLPSIFRHLYPLNFPRHFNNTTFGDRANTNDSGLSGSNERSSSALSGDSANSSKSSVDANCLKNLQLDSESGKETADRSAAREENSETSDSFSGNTSSRGCDSMQADDDLDRDIELSEMDESNRRPTRTLKRKSLPLLDCLRKVMGKITKDRSAANTMADMDDASLREVIERVVDQLDLSRPPARFSDAARMTSYIMDDIDLAVHESVFAMDVSSAKRNVINAKKLRAMRESTGDQFFQAMGLEPPRIISSSSLRSPHLTKHQILRERVTKILESMRSEGLKKKMKIVAPVDPPPVPQVINDVATSFAAPQQKPSVLDSARARVLSRIRVQEEQPSAVRQTQYETVVNSSNFVEETDPSNDYHHHHHQSSSPTDQWSLNLGGLYDDYEHPGPQPNVEMDYEVSRKIWESQVAIEFCLGPSDDTESVPLYIMLPRCSYFSLALPKVINFFNSRESNEKFETENIWLESNGSPLKLYVPIGALYDLYTGPNDVTWTVYIRTSRQPDDYVHIDKDAMESIFMQSLKEAAYLKRKTEVVNAMKSEEHKQLWSSVALGRFDDFWNINKKLMDTTDRNFESVPLRLYERDKPFRQVKLSCTDVNGRYQTFREALQTVLPNADFETISPMPTTSFMSSSRQHHKAFTSLSIYYFDVFRNYTEGPRMEFSTFLT
ncbi:unnamed protein product [Caenorhabditis auriculariae]|uniref:Sm domain-containing protein n=1 Tax=Caenorhabditis auriculariae TaxID=2777116 RepID=A0A8S1GUD5_9PELO|nr:unnamed protein product [Caenorhabditis auriculariae]